MLARLVIDNFRSIKHLDIPLGPTNIFVGANNSGKSTILEALNILLGESYPSVRSFDDRDYHMREIANPICITAYLDAPIQLKDVFGNPHNAWGYKAQLSRYKRRTSRAEAGDPKFDYTMIGVDGKDLQMIQRHASPRGKPFPQPVNVSNEHRSFPPLLYVGIDRNILS